MATLRHQHHWSAGTGGLPTWPPFVTSTTGRPGSEGCQHGHPSSPAPLVGRDRRVANMATLRHQHHWSAGTGGSPTWPPFVTSTTGRPGPEGRQHGHPSSPAALVGRDRRVANMATLRHQQHWSAGTGGSPTWPPFVTSTTGRPGPEGRQHGHPSSPAPLVGRDRRVANMATLRYQHHWSAGTGGLPTWPPFVTSTTGRPGPEGRQHGHPSSPAPLVGRDRRVANMATLRHQHHWSAGTGGLPTWPPFVTSTTGRPGPEGCQHGHPSSPAPLVGRDRRVANMATLRHQHHWSAGTGGSPTWPPFVTSTTGRPGPEGRQHGHPSSPAPLVCRDRRVANMATLRHQHHWSAGTGGLPTWPPFVTSSTDRSGSEGCQHGHPSLPAPLVGRDRRVANMATLRHQQH